MSAKDHSQIQMGLALYRLQAAKRQYQLACDEYHKSLIQSNCEHEWTHRVVSSILDDVAMDSWRCDKCNMAVFFNPEEENEQ